jgi:hypothetical protein
MMNKGRTDKFFISFLDLYSIINFKKEIAQFLLSIIKSYFVDIYISFVNFYYPLKDTKQTPLDFPIYLSRWLDSIQLHYSLLATKIALKI